MTEFPHAAYSAMTSAFPSAAGSDRMEALRGDLILIDEWISMSMVAFVNHGRHLPIVPDVYAAISSLRTALEDVDRTSTDADAGTTFIRYLDLLEQGYAWYLLSAPSEPDRMITISAGFDPGSGTLFLRGARSELLWLPGYAADRRSLACDTWDRQGLEPVSVVRFRTHNPSQEETEMAGVRFADSVTFYGTGRFASLKAFTGRELVRQPRRSAGREGWSAGLQLPATDETGLPRGGDRVVSIVLVGAGDPV